MPETLSPQAMSNLIGSIYDSALDPARWERTLVEIAEAFDGTRFRFRAACEEIAEQAKMAHEASAPLG
jgi:hypothetical protein